MATRDIVPRADSEGGIGTTLKRWAAGWFDAINGKDISSGVATTTELTTHTESTSNPHNVTKAQVGLGNCDNTADSGKPVSTAQQAALDGKVSHSLATAANDVLVASGAGAFVKKTLAELKTILGLGTAAYTASTDYAAATKGVTNGDSHDHSGGDGGQISHAALSSIGTNTHAQIDTHLASTSNPHGATAEQVGAIPATTGSATSYVSAATTSAAGKVQLATSTEATTGTDTAKAVTPAALAAALLAAIGIDPIDLPRNSDLGTAAYLDQTWLYASTTWDAGSCANASQVSTTVAVPGAEIGDKVMPSASIALSGLSLRGEVTATDVVTLYLVNLTGSSVDLASATYYVAVLKLTPAR